MGVIEGAYDLRINTGAPGNGTNEVQTLTLANATGGTFKLAFDGFITAAITWSATTNTLLANINTALRALPNIGASGITATDSTLSSGNGDVLLTFGGNLAKMAVSTITVALNSLTGSSPTVAVAETTPGVTATERGAGIGALLVNISNGAVYSNTGTALEPTWTLIGTVAAGSVGTTELTDLGVTQAKLEVGAAGAGLSGLVLKFAADANVIGAVPVVHRIAVASGANGNVDVALTHKTRILDGWYVMKGAGTAGCTLQLKNVTTAITEASDCSAKSDKDKTSWTSIDDAQHEIAAGANLRVSKASTGGDFPGAEVYVLGVRVA